MISISYILLFVNYSFADSKVSDLIENTNPVSGDFLYAVEIPVGSTSSGKVTISNMLGVATDLNSGGDISNDAVDAAAIATDAVGTSEFNDGSDTPSAGECVIVATDTATVEYGACGSGSGDSVTVNSTGVDTTANFLNGDIDWTLVDGGAGGPDDITGTVGCTNCVTLATETVGDYVNQITAGTNLTSTGATSGEDISHSLSVDDAFLVNNADDTTTGTITATGYIGNLYDASGAVDLDIGSGDVLDITLSENGGTYIFDNGLDIGDDNLTSVGQIEADTLIGDGATLVIGDNSETIAINSSDWDIGTTGTVTNTLIDGDDNTLQDIAISQTKLVAGTNITLSTDTLNVDDAFLVNDANDSTTGILTATGGFIATDIFEAVASGVTVINRDFTTQKLILGDSEPIELGVGTDAILQWDETQTHDSLQLGLNVASDEFTGVFSIMEDADLGNSGRDGIDNFADPRLRVYSSDATSSTDYIQMYHDQTNSYLANGVGNLILDGGGDVINDVALNFYWKIWENGTPMVQVRPNQSFDQFTWGLADAGGNQMVFTNINHADEDFNHDLTADPTIFIQSDTDPDSDNTEWLSFHHDRENANITVGKGGIQLAVVDVPAVSSCGTTPAITGNSNVGKVTIGSSASSTCTLTFDRAWSNAPGCALTNGTVDVPVFATTTTTTLVITDGAQDFSSDVIMYVCFGF